MKIRKLAALLLALAMALPLWGLAEENHQFEGYVTEIIDGGFVLEDIQRGQVILNTDDSTVWDGLLIDGELEAGMYVMVDYDGRLTRSIPPQAHADRVGCYTLQGAVSEVAENGLLLTGDERFGDVWVKTGLVDARHVYPGMTLLVYYDGIMAMSLPGQVTAHQMEIPSLQGTVSDKQADSFLLTTEGGEEYRILLTDETLIGLVSAAVETEDDALAEADTQTEEALSLTLDWGDGDAVIVYYSGEAAVIQDDDETTADTDADPLSQLTALEINVIR